MELRPFAKPMPDGLFETGQKAKIRLLGRIFAFCED
jgi:hypothetical protein